MIKVYFVRHAQPEHGWEDDRTRPLTVEGKKDTKKVFKFLKDKNIDKFYCSPYKRSMDTLAETAEYFGKEIITDERLREREKGRDGNHHGMFQKRWADLEFHEDGGESITMVQRRNIAALQDILFEYHTVVNEKDIHIVIGTHGTALSSILHYYESDYNCDSFLRIIDWMPYIIELDFDRDNCIGKKEHLYIEKEFKGKERADKLGGSMELSLQTLQHHFIHKPLLVGGKAMEYYNLRKAGNDIDLIVHRDDHEILMSKYPNNVKDLYGDIGICEFGYEMWNQICMFDYDYLKSDAVEETDYLVVSLEKLLFLKALAMEIPKYHKDLELVVDLVLKRAYGKV